MSAPSQPPAKESNGIVLPMWLLQVVPIVALVAAGVGVYATARSDVDQLKQSNAELKAVIQQQQQLFVSKQIFDLKVEEHEKQQQQINQRLDKIEYLINGLYERLPAKAK